MTTPDPAAPVAGTDVVERLLRWPLDEFEGDFADDMRDAAAEIARLRAELAEARERNFRTVLGFEVGQADAAIQLKRFLVVADAAKAVLHSSRLYNDLELAALEKALAAAEWV